MSFVLFLSSSNQLSHAEYLARWQDTSVRTVPDLHRHYSIASTTYLVTWCRNRCYEYRARTFQWTCSCMLVRPCVHSRRKHSITYFCDLTLRKVRLREKLTPHSSFRDNIRLGRVARERSRFQLTVEIVFGKGKRPFFEETCSKKA